MIKALLRRTLSKWIVGYRDDNFESDFFTRGELRLSNIELNVEVAAQELDLPPVLRLHRVYCTSVTVTASLRTCTCARTCAHIDPPTRSPARLADPVGGGQPHASISARGGAVCCGYRDH